MRRIPSHGFQIFRLTIHFLGTSFNQTGRFSPDRPRSGTQISAVDSLIDGLRCNPSVSQRRIKTRAAFTVAIAAKHLSSRQYRTAKRRNQFGQPPVNPVPCRSACPTRPKGNLMPFARMTSKLWQALRSVCSGRQNERNRLLTTIPILLVPIWLSCARHKQPISPSDTTPPAAITDLTATPINHRAIKLKWTASGDDGNAGQAARYDIHIQTMPFPSEGHFPPGDTVAAPPRPSLAGQSDSVTVTGLKPATRYYFALRVADDVGLLSSRSNQATATTEASPDTIPPAVVTDLRLQDATNTTITVTWTAPGDDDHSGKATRYDLRYAEAPLTAANWPQATPVAGVPAPAEAGVSQTAKLLGLAAAHTYYLGIQAYDETENSSGLSPSLQAATSRPRTWLVREDRTGDSPTIQSAIDQAWWGDTVLVSPGTYFENIAFRGRDIVLCSSQGSDATILDGSRQSAAVVLINQGETRATVIQGFTIRNGSSRRGGGISCQAASPTVTQNRITGNSGLDGGGMYIGSSSFLDPVQEPIVIANTFDHNSASSVGGGLRVEESSRVTISHNLFQSNTSLYDGGGLYVQILTHSVSITGNIFIDNLAHDKGGGLFIAQSQAGTGSVIADNLFARNSSYGEDSASRKESGGGAVFYGLSGILIHNTFVQNHGHIETAVGAGGFTLDGTGDSLVVNWNLVAFNDGVGIVSQHNGDAREFYSNLCFQNSDGALQGIFGNYPQPWAAALVVQDPLRCPGTIDSVKWCTTSIVFNNSETIGVRQPPGCAECQQVRQVSKKQEQVAGE